MTKRKFLKLGMSGGAAMFLGSLLRPLPAWGSTVQVPSSYLDSAVHGHWMKLCYSHRQESRQTRRLLGATLRNLGGVRGIGRGHSFVPCFDRAVEAVWQRSRATGRTPGSIFALIQALYDESLYAQTGVAGGQILFGLLFSLLRGRDGTEQGTLAHQAYLNYRSAVVAHKEAYRMVNDPQAIAELRKRRSLLLQEWQAQWGTLVGRYATRQARLNPAFQVEPAMLDGLDLPAAVKVPLSPRLTMARTAGRLVVTWAGNGRLQQAPSPLGPWTDTAQASPAVIEARESQQFFRTIQPSR